MSVAEKALENLSSPPPFEGGNERCTLSCSRLQQTSPTPVLNYFLDLSVLLIFLSCFAARSSLVFRFVVFQTSRRMSDQVYERISQSDQHKKKSKLMHLQDDKDRRTHIIPNNINLNNRLCVASLKYVAHVGVKLTLHSLNDDNLHQLTALYR
jgi:hypothetical protein